MATRRKKKLPTLIAQPDTIRHAIWRTQKRLLKLPAIFDLAMAHPDANIDSLKRQLHASIGEERRILFVLRGLLVGLDAEKG